MAERSSRVLPKTLKVTLQNLDEEIESRSEALPPDETALNLWKRQLDHLWEQVRALRRDARNELWAQVQRIGDRIESLRSTKESFHIYAEALDASPSLGAVTSRSRLASAIGGALLPPSNLQVQPQPALLHKPRTTPSASPRRADAPTPTLKRVVPPVIPKTSKARAAKILRVPALKPIAPAAPTPSIPIQYPSETLRRPVSHLNDVPSLRRRLAPATQSLRTDPIVAYVGRLARASAFDEARALACDWLRSKRFNVPTDADSDFELSRPRGDKAVVVRYEGVWAMQADTIESADRRWRVEMVLVDDPTSSPALSLVLYAIGSADQPVPDASVPRLAADLIDKIGLIDARDGSTLSTAPDRIQTDQEVNELVSRLESPGRQHPVVVLSEYHKDDKVKTLLDPDGLAQRLRGLAHVAVLGVEQRAAWALTERVSKRFTVFGPAVRLYRTGFTTEDDTSLHPFWTPQELEREGRSLGDLQQVLLRESAQASLRGLDREDEVPAFDEVQKAVLKRRIERAQSKRQFAVGEVASKERITELERALVEANELNDLFSKDAQVAKDQRDQVATERDEANAKIIYLEARVQSLEKRQVFEPEPEPPAPPRSWDSLEQWADDNLGKSVVLTPKAIRAARNSTFENVSFAYQVLLFLANTYVPSKCGALEGGNARLEAEKLRLGIDVSPVGDAATAHRSRNTYTASYKGRSVRLDMHIRGPSDRDPRYGFRLYFHWEPSDQCVVVGWFPSHLNNSLS